LAATMGIFPIKFLDTNKFKGVPSIPSSTFPTLCANYLLYHSIWVLSFSIKELWSCARIH
jgi:hypothetical protein